MTFPSVTRPQNGSSVRLQSKSSRWQPAHAPASRSQQAIAASSSVVDEGLECSGVEAALTALRQELRLAHAATRREAEGANSCEVEAKRCKSQVAASNWKHRVTCDGFLQRGVEALDDARSSANTG